MPRRNQDALTRAADPTTPPSVLVAMSRTPDKYVLSTLAANPALPGEVAATLAQSPDKYVRTAVAGNRATPQTALDVLADDADGFVRSTVAKNPHASPTTLSRMAEVALGRSGARPQAVTNDQRWVLRNLSGNPSTPEPVLLRLIGIPKIASEVAAGLSQRTPPPRSKTISITKFDGRRSAPHLISVPIEEPGRFSAALMEAMVASGVRQMVNLAVSQPDAPVALLAQVAGWDVAEWKWTLNRIADNPGATFEVLSTLIATGDNDLLLTVNQRDDLDMGMVERMLQHGGPKVQYEVVHRDETTATRLAQSETWIRLRLARAFDPAIDSRALAVALLGDADSEVRAAAASRVGESLLNGLYEVDDLCVEARMALAEQTARTAILERLASDQDKRVRRRVVRNRSCPVDCLIALSDDSDSVTRRYAAERVMGALDTLA